MSVQFPILSYPMYKIHLYIFLCLKKPGYKNMLTLHIKSKKNSV